MGQHGWPFASVDPYPAADADPVNNSEHVKDLYFKAQPDYEGRYVLPLMTSLYAGCSVSDSFTVPVLWDKKTSTIVNNESSEIIRMFNTAFNDFIPADKAALDFYPEHLRKEIDEVNEWVYDTVNSE